MNTVKAITERCTHGADCTVHPDVQQQHNLDPAAVDITIGYNRGDATTVTLTVPDLGLTPEGWAAAVYVATNVPFTHQYGQAGAREIAAALTELDPAIRIRAVLTGDTVTVRGPVTLNVRVVGAEPVDGWGLRTATYDRQGTPMTVGPHQPPPDRVAYVEDVCDRLWALGGGTWRCLTDLSGVTGGLSQSWEQLWVNFGPLVPLVPATVTPDPDATEVQP